MYEYLEISKYLNNIADYLKKDMVPLSAIQADMIAGMVRSVYDAGLENGDFFADLYRKLISKAMEHNDREEMEYVLMMLAESILIVSQPKTRDNRARILQSRLGYQLNCEKIRIWNEKHEQKDATPFQGRGVVYSAVTGEYDDIKEPEFVSRDLEYVMFTDNPDITSDIWKVVLIHNENNLDNVRLARKIKIMGHEFLPEYDYSIWVDGKLTIKGDLREYIERYRKNQPILCFNHYANDCIYKEWETCVALEKDNPEVMAKQMARYRQEGYPEENGLVESGLMVRELHDERVRRVMETWWSEVLNYSKRDQLSFNYACWKRDFVFDTTDLFIYDNPYVKIHGHNRR